MSTPLGSLTSRNRATRILQIRPCPHSVSNQPSLCDWISPPQSSGNFVLPPIDFLSWKPRLPRHKSPKLQELQAQILRLQHSGNQSRWVTSLRSSWTIKLDSAPHYEMPSILFRAASPRSQRLHHRITCSLLLSFASDLRPLGAPFDHSSVGLSSSPARTVEYLGSSITCLANP